MEKKTLIKPGRLFALSFSALGVVYGDIGTSPLYAFRQSFAHIPATSENILGVLSLIFWALILVISVKYLFFILRVDNDGEGGTVALLSLLRRKDYSRKAYTCFFLLGLFGTALLFSDGMLTPAVSVVSAVEGLSIVSPYFKGFIIFLAFIILLWLFLFQWRGTERVGVFFAPFMLIWFITIGSLGLVNIIQNLTVLEAINPWHAFLLFQHYHLHAYLILSGVFLVVTGGEALYADIGHFGTLPIRTAWFSIVLPGLLLNYFGQGADAMINPGHLKSPFYFLAPHWFMFPLIIIATIATIIASQAIISAVFSLAKQAIALRLLPRMYTIFTSRELKGQVYIPTINFIMAIGTLWLVMTFKTSTNLANAYGLAVNLDMVVVTTLITILFYKRLLWSLPKVILFGCIFLFIDFSFLGANGFKIIYQGWFPVAFAIMGTLIMLVWRQGLKLLYEFRIKKGTTLNEIASKMYSENIVRIPGIGVFITEAYDQGGTCLLYYLQSNKMVHETTVLLSVEIENKPIVSIDNRVEMLKRVASFYQIKLHYGFMQVIDVPNTLEKCIELRILPFSKSGEEITYYLEMIKAQIIKKANSIPLWQRKLFAIMLNNLRHDISFYRLPVNFTIIFGTYHEI